MHLNTSILIYIYEIFNIIKLIKNILINFNSIKNYNQLIFQS